MLIGAVLSSTLSVSAQTRLKDGAEIPDFVKTTIVTSLDRGATIGEGSLRVTGEPAGAVSSLLIPTTVRRGRPKRAHKGAARA